MHGASVHDTPGPGYHEQIEVTMEHIKMGSDALAEQKVPTHVSLCKTIKNPVQNTTTEFTFYEEGFLKIREGSKKKLHREHVFELRFIDPKLTTVLQLAVRWVIVAATLGCLAILTLVYLPETKFSYFVAPISLSLAVLAGMFLFFFAYHSTISHCFGTASGKAGVLSLTGSIGCFGPAEEMAFRVQKAIKRASAEPDLVNTGYLRAEMRAHYKLAEIGVITQDECTEVTSRILNKFS